MGVAVLNLQDCLRNPLTSRQALIPPPPRAKRNPNPNPNPNLTRGPSRASNPSRRKRTPNHSPPPRTSVFQPKNLVMGQVKILRRGERLEEKSPPDSAPEKAEKSGCLDLGSTARIGPDPGSVPIRIRLGVKSNGFYAGSAFVASPPPSELPLPAFFMRKCGIVSDDRNEDATSDLCRMLGLGF